MPGRYYIVPALILWGVSMSWLFSTKILPSLSSGTPPNYADILPTKAESLAPISWTIRWDERDIGWAENRISRSLDGSGKIVSVVQFEKLPIAEMLREVLGVLWRFAEPLVPEEMEPLDISVTTKLDFDNYGVLDRFDTRIDMGDFNELLRIEGRVTGDQLDLAARVQGEDNSMRDVFRKQVTLPPDALLADSFSPRPQLNNLRVGQSWTFQSYRPLTPTSPLELIQATVDGEQIIGWNGQLMEVYVVSYSRDSGSGLSSTRTSLSRAWVAKDGRVLQQELVIGKVDVQFIRRPDSPDAK